MTPTADVIDETRIASRAASRSAAQGAGKPELVLKSREFRKGREEGWRELEDLVARVERRGVRSLSLDELERLPILYRAALSSLSVSRTIALDRNLLLYLENLALRAYLAVYGPSVDPIEGLHKFLVYDLPRAVRAARWHILIVTIALLVGVAVGFVLTVQDEAWLSTFMPADMAGGRGPASTAAALRDKELFAPWPGPVEAFGIFANVLFSHNTAVGLLCFGLGLAAGIPTLMLVVYQGLSLGAFVALHYDRGLTVECLGWLSIHGTSELGALILLGAGGLVIADKILFPGRYSRIENLALHGRQAAQMAVGGILMLFVAGVLEGGFRQLVQSTPLRFAIGLTIGALWIVYYSRCGKKTEQSARQ
jgi:uncharacterized membrane protein SpoIIM required for sporulation